jgi:hypothetical protein
MGSRRNVNSHANLIGNEQIAIDLNMATVSCISNEVPRPRKIRPAEGLIFQRDHRSGGAR